MKDAVIGLVIVAYLWGAWLCLPFVDVHTDDEEKPYFLQRVRTGEKDGQDRYSPRWYAFPFFLNVAVTAAIAWFAIWLFGSLK